MKQSLLFLFLIALISCSTSEKQGQDFTTIIQNLPPSENIIDFEEYFKVTDIISLETNDSSIIDFVHEVLIDDYLFIKGGGAVYKFDRKGTFISKIEKEVDGQNAFKNLTDVILLPQQKRIWIYDSNKRNILQFDYDLNFEVNYKLGFPLFGIEKLNESLLGTPGYMMSIDKPHSLIKFSGDNLATGYSVKESYLPFNIEKSKYLHINRDDYFSYTERDGFNFVNSFNDSIYYIDQSGVPKVEYYIDFEDKKVLEEDLTDRGYSTIVDVFTFINSTNKSFNVGNIFQSKMYLVYRFFNSGIPYLSVYKKNDGSLVSAKKVRFNFYDTEVIVDLDEEMRIGSLGDGIGYISFPLDGGILSSLKEFDYLDKLSNPIIILFNEK